MGAIIGTSCVILTAVAMVGSVVFIECPPLSALAGAVAGTAVEIFMQVVISEKDLGNVDWRKVAIGAATGALSGFLGPYLAASYGGFAYFALDSSIDGLIDGIERATEAWMDGDDAADIINSFGTGFALGFALSAGFKGLGASVSKIASKMGPGVRKTAERYLPNLTKKVSAIKLNVGSAVNSMKKAADNTIGNLLSDIPLLVSLVKPKLPPMTAKQNCETRYRHMFFNHLVRLITIKETGKESNDK